MPPLNLTLFIPRDVCPPLEELLASDEYFKLTTASALQRAICRVLDGLSLGSFASHPDVIAAFGGELAVQLYEEFRFRPKTLVLLAGVRSGKSLIAAAAAYRSARTCDTRVIRPGEPAPRASIVSTTKDTAAPTWEHVRGHLEASAKLRATLIGEPKASGSLQVRHVTGAPVEIAVVAGARGASTLVARWSAGVIFDEAPRMVGEDEGVVNIDHARKSIAARMLPGAPTILSGSPWAPFGPVYDLVQKHHGEPSREVLVIRARGDAMAPPIWTPEACEALRLSDPDAYRVDVLCEFLDPVAGLFSTAELEACITHDSDCEPPRAGHYYSAAIDPATRGNAWTLIILEHTRSGAARIKLAKQWIGSVAEPLSPKATFAEIAELLKPYGTNTLHTDQWAADALIELASEAGLWLISETITEKIKLEMFKHLGARVADRTLELPRVRELIRDLASVRRKTTATGVSIHLPLNAAGRHCDYASALALALQHMPREPESEERLAAADAHQLTEDKRRAMLRVQMQQRSADEALRRQLGLD